MAVIEIVEFSDEWAADFASLNYEWIERYFAVEKHDREILDDPKRFVIEPGGQIFMALAGGTAAGTVALIPSAGNGLELTKMAVSPHYQGRGIGDRLMTRCLEWAKQKRVDYIFLESHRKLAPALALYRKHGFVETPKDPDSLYVRADVRMELRLA